MYVILNRALSLDGMTKAQAEEGLGLPIKTAVPYMGAILLLPTTFINPSQ
jgi:hypothetical protein